MLQVKLESHPVAISRSQVASSLQPLAARTPPMPLSPSIIPSSSVLRAQEVSHYMDYSCLISELLVLFCTPVYTAQSKSLFISIDRERKSRIKLLLLYNLCIYKNMARTMFVLQRLATSHLYLKNRK